jgi:hypothetical protein
MSPERNEDGYDEVHAGANYSDEEREFLLAIEKYQRASGRRYLSWHEVLRVLKSLGYRKVA